MSPTCLTKQTEIKCQAVCSEYRVRTVFAKTPRISRSNKQYLTAQYKGMYGIIRITNIDLLLIRLCNTMSVVLRTLIGRSFPKVQSCAPHIRIRAIYRFMGFTFRRRVLLDVLDAVYAGLSHPIHIYILKINIFIPLQRDLSRELKTMVLSL